MTWLSEPVGGRAVPVTFARAGVAHS